MLLIIIIFILIHILNLIFISFLNLIPGYIEIKIETYILYLAVGLHTRKQESKFSQRKNILLQKEYSLTFSVVPNESLSPPLQQPNLDPIHNALHPYQGRT